MNMLKLAFDIIALVLFLSSIQTCVHESNVITNLILISVGNILKVISNSVRRFGFLASFDRILLCGIF